MTLKRALNKLGKVTTVKNNGNLYWGVINNTVVEFIVNGKHEDDNDIMCIRVRGCNDKDDFMTDYCAGVWCDNLSQAIRLASY